MAGWWVGGWGGKGEGRGESRVASAFFFVCICSFRFGSGVSSYPSAPFPLFLSSRLASFPFPRSFSLRLVLVRFSFSQFPVSSLCFPFSFSIWFRLARFRTYPTSAFFFFYDLSCVSFPLLVRFVSIFSLLSVSLSLSPSRCTLESLFLIYVLLSSSTSLVC